jgi:hypothetical protein
VGDEGGEGGSGRMVMCSRGLPALFAVQLFVLVHVLVQAFLEAEHDAIQDGWVHSKNEVHVWSA